MREDWVRKDVFEKVVLVKGIVKSTIPKLIEVDDEELKLMFSHLAHYHRDDERNTLNETELILYDTLIRNDVNPATVYKWFCLTMMPNDLFHQLGTGRISQKRALMLNAKRRRDKEIAMGLEIMEIVRETMRRL
ncbi:hypothetical protein AUJ83_01910 [Candidatus Woesearchaeota archaeon CG1_02_33_12]|nr:MAG: hypothetical protein AUJ83_01910 [Candidatus Woesearchaeota archaeon CG1_02_33_12]